MNITEATAKLNSLGDQLEKASTEILKEIETLKAATVNVQLPAEAEAAIDRLTAKAQALDDINPDAPVPAPSTLPAAPAARPRTTQLNRESA